MTINSQYLKISYILDSLVIVRDNQRNKKEREACQDIINQVINLAKDIRHTHDPIAAIMEANR